MFSFSEIAGKFKLPLTDPILVFSLILLIILFSPILLRKLNIPSIIGLIISGIIIGPHGFNVLEKNDAINLFSTIGLLYIMFIAGLELNLKEFIANRNKSLVFGFFTFIIPIAAGFPIAYYVLDYPVLASFLIASMFATQTLVAYPIVSKLGVSKNEAVAITVGGTIFTDTAVLINLAIIKNLNVQNVNSEFWIFLVIQLFVFMLIVFGLIPPITRYFFSHLESEKYSHYIFVMSVLFLSAFLAQVAGLEPIIGAFAAGLALNPLIPKSGALMNRIEFIGNSLFIPFFLISVGMIIDLRVFFKGFHALWVAFVLIILALLGKWLAALFTQWIFRYSATQRQLIYGLSSAHAAAILAFILVGYNEQIIDEKVFNSTIILILVSCVVSSFVTEKNAKKLLLELDSNPSITENVFIQGDNILMPIVNWEKLPNVLRFAILFRNKNSFFPISLLTIVPNDTEAEANILKSREKVEAFMDTASATETPINTIVTIDQNVAGGIIRTAREIMANTIIMGWSQSSSFFDKILGKTSDTILDALDKTIIIADIKKPINIAKRIILYAPRYAEHEFGFAYWCKKILKLSEETMTSIVFYGCHQTKNAMENIHKQYSHNTTLQFIETPSFFNFLTHITLFKETDLIVVVASRKGSISYESVFDELPTFMNKYLELHTRIIIYPQQEGKHYKDMNIIYEEAKNPLLPGIKAIKYVGKGLNYIFKKKK